MKPSPLASFLIFCVCVILAPASTLASAELGVALDAPHLEWQGDWVAQSEISYDGVSAAMSTPTARQEYRDLITHVEGPGVLRFWYKLEASSAAALLFWVNGRYGFWVDERQASGDWEMATVKVEAGSTELCWRFHDTGGGNRLFVDQVSWVPGYRMEVKSLGTVVGLSPEKEIYAPGEVVRLEAEPIEGADFVGWYGDVTSSEKSVDVVMDRHLTVQSVSSLPLAEGLGEVPAGWTTGGDAPWFVIPEVSLGGKIAGRSGIVGASEVSWVETTVTGPGRVSWTWERSFPVDMDFMIDGVLRRRHLSPRVLQDEVFFLGEGTFTLRWQMRVHAHATFEAIGFLQNVRYQEGYLLDATALRGMLNFSVPGEDGFYPPGTSVEVGVVPDGDYEFLGWLGDLSGLENPVTLTLDKHWLLVANCGIPYSVASGAANLDWEVADIPPWFGMYSEEAGFYLRSPDLGLQQKSRLVAMVEGPGQLSFLVAGEGSGPGLEFDVNGRRVEHITVGAAAGWVKKTLLLGEGTHRVEWWNWVGYVPSTRVFKIKDVEFIPGFRFYALSEEGRVVVEPEKLFFAPGEEVTFTAVPQTGRAFDYWFGSISSSQARENPLVLKINHHGSVWAAWTISVPFATGAPELQWSTGNPPWRGWPAGGHQEAVVESPGRDPSWVEAVVEGPGTLCFRIHPAFTEVRLEIDGVPERIFNRHWEDACVVIPPGRRVVRWDHRPNGMSSRARLAGVVFLGEDELGDWRRKHFPESDLQNATRVGLLATPQGKGAPNWVRFAAGVSPFAAEMPRLWLEADDEAGLRLRHWRVADADRYGIFYNVEVSADLRDWTDFHVPDFSLGGDTGGGDSSWLNIPVGTGAEETRFFRMNIRFDP
jgi:hypothetical protein